MIIAEAGLWHQGNVDKAHDLVRTAKACGADAIKFQIFAGHDPLFCPLEGDEKRYHQWTKSRLLLDDWRAVAKHAGGLGIKFGASVFQPAGVELLKDLNPDFVKVASRAASTFPYEEFDAPFYISNGMMSGMEMHKLGIRLSSMDKDYVFLYCVPKYPAPLKKARWPHCNGLSDHSGTPYVAIEALARGCTTVEVHFTLLHEDGAPDDDVSLLPDQLKMICEARDVFAQMR